MSPACNMVVLLSYIMLLLLVVTVRKEFRDIEPHRIYYITVRNDEFTKLRERLFEVLK